MNWLNYIIVGLLSILIIGCGTNTQTTEDTSIIKKTGQVTSYDENGLEVPNNTLKDDGFYQKGLTPRYSRDDQKKIVTDHLTGLEWQDTADVALEDKNWMKSELMGECSDDYGNPSCPDGNCSLCYDTSGDTATTYCSELTLDGGGWRLPTLEELTYIVDKGKVAPSIDPVFKYVKDTRYFTSTTGSGFLPITVFFDEGFSLKYFPKVYNFRAHVRCVRGTGDDNVLKSSQFH
ncbi:MAG: DUF1566 domain-containing protein [Sulfurovum sp.]|nr:DUF1566 domain-containing protein [Sulfurovum sp.]